MMQEEKSKVFKFTIDNKHFETENGFITGNEIKKIANINPTYGIWLKINGPQPDEEIGDNQAVDLSRPGIEKFFSGPKTTTEGDKYVSSRV